MLYNKLLGGLLSKHIISVATPGRFFPNRYFFIFFFLHLKVYRYNLIRGLNYKFRRFYFELKDYNFDFLLRWTGCQVPRIFNKENSVQYLLYCCFSSVMTNLTEPGLRRSERVRRRWMWRTVSCRLTRTSPPARRRCCCASETATGSPRRSGAACGSWSGAKSDSGGRRRGRYCRPDTPDTG